MLGCEPWSDRRIAMETSGADGKISHRETCPDLEVIFDKFRKIYSTGIYYIINLVLK